MGDNAEQSLGWQRIAIDPVTGQQWYDEYSNKRNIIHERARKLKKEKKKAEGKVPVGADWNADVDGRTKWRDAVESAPNIPRTRSEERDGDSGLASVFCLSV